MEETSFNIMTQKVIFRYKCFQFLRLLYNHICKSKIIIIILYKVDILRKNIYLVISDKDKHIFTGPYLKLFTLKKTSYKSK